MRPTILVCDRYSAYKKLARLRSGEVTLSFCWAHVRRDFLRCASGHADLADWSGGWIDRIAEIYRLHGARLESYNPDLDRQAPEFCKIHAKLCRALDNLFALAERELACLPDDARAAKPLRSLCKHREGLSVLRDRPRVPLDNNLVERVLRAPAIGRRLSFGSDSEDGARFTALMYSVIGTLEMNNINVRRWLHECLMTCAHAGGPPDNLSLLLPWSMDARHKKELAMPP